MSSNGRGRSETRENRPRVLKHARTVPVFLSSLEQFPCFFPCNFNGYGDFFALAGVVCVRGGSVSVCVLRIGFFISGDVLMAASRLVLLHHDL